jgi:predicted ATPase
MIESAHFQNFKALRDATLPLGRFTLIVGPNGSGKSTALQGIRGVGNPGLVNTRQIVTAGVKNSVALVKLSWGEKYVGIQAETTWVEERNTGPSLYRDSKKGVLSVGDQVTKSLQEKLHNIRVYSFDAQVIPASVSLLPNIELQENGANLAGVLDRLRDEAPERFEALNEALGLWLPEFDRILFETPTQGQRAFLLRTRQGHYKIPAANLSQGTLLALALLTLAYLPFPPSVVCLEEPDRGIHPRLLRDVQDALYRLSYPESCGEKREPVQVVATTHSPYLLDLFRDHPEEVVIAEKGEDGARFERLSERSDLDEILRGSHLGEVWYTGVLGGVPLHI